MLLALASATLANGKEGMSSADRRLLDLLWHRRWDEAAALLSNSSGDERAALALHAVSFDDEHAPLSLVSAILTLTAPHLPPPVGNARTGLARYAQAHAVRAAGSGNIELLTLAIAHGAKMNERDAYGQTIAARAAETGSVDVLTHAIIYGADLGVRTNSGNTARSLALYRRRPASIMVLNSFSTAAAYLMAVRRYDDLHVWQCVNADPEVEHKEIRALADWGERFVGGGGGEGIAGIMLHRLHGKEKGITRLILSYLFPGRVKE